MIKISTAAGEPFFVSILGTMTHSVQEILENARYQFEEAGVVNFALSMPLQPQGRNPLEKVGAFAEKFRALRDKSADVPFNFGILIQQTIGHGARWNPNYDRELPWQRLIYQTGVESIRFCPLDEDFKNYVDSAMQLLMAEGPAFAIIDDDTSLAIPPASNNLECFCPLHTALFNEMYGTSYTPEELRKAVTPESNQEIQAQFRDMGDESILRYVKMMRRSIDKAAPGLPVIFCAGSIDAARSDEWAEAAAAQGQPSVLRCGTSNYLEGAPWSITGRYTTTAVQKLYSSRADLLLDEADTCPHSLYSKSARTMHLHIVNAMLDGLDGAKLWIANTVHADDVTTPPYARILGKNMGLYRELHRVMRDFSWAGALNVLPHPRQSLGPSYSGYEFLGAWVDSYLALFGIPFRWGKPSDRGVALLTGAQIERLSSAELEKLLSGEALLDLSAAEKAVERGFGKLIGVESVSDLPRLAVLEKLERNGKIFRLSRGAYRQLNLLPGAEVISTLLERKSFSGDEFAPLAPGAIRFGKVVTAAWRAVSGNRIDLCPDRREMILEYLSNFERILDIQVNLNSFAGFRYGYCSDGTMIAALTNYGYDPLEKLEFTVKNCPRRIEVLQGDGSWKELPFTAKGNTVTLEYVLNCAEFIIMRLK